MKLLFMANVVICLLLYQSCNDCNGEPSIDYTFSIPNTVSPAQDTFQIGDTIWFKTDFSNLLFDQKSKEYYLFDNFDFKMVFFVSKINITPYEDGMSNFDFLPIQGELSVGASGFGYEISTNYEYINDRYQSEFALIAKSTGTYSSQFASLLPPGYEQDDGLVNFSDECNRERIEVYASLNEGIDGNYYLIPESPDSIIRMTTEYVYNLNGVFSFVVVE